MTASFGGAGNLTVVDTMPGHGLFGSEGSLSYSFTVVEPESGNPSGTGQLGTVVSEPYPAPGEFPDWEHVLVDMLTPITYTCTTLPPTKELTEAALPLILVRRMGGGLDYSAITDKAQMKAVCLSWTRAQSYQLAQQVREAFLGSTGGTSVNGVLIDFAHEITGAIEMSDLDPLNRTVEVDFYFYGRRQLAT